MYTPRAQGILHVLGRPAVAPPFTEHFLQQALVVDPSVSHDVLLVVEDTSFASIANEQLTEHQA
jgi:hypothetical protein